MNEHDSSKWTAAPIYRGFGELERALDFLIERDFAENVYVCGGYLRWACSPVPDPVPPGDVDLYCVDEDTYKRLRWHLVRTLQRKRKAENAVSVTFLKEKRVENPFFGLPAVQLIKPLDDGNVKTNGDLFDVLSNFDFSIIRLGAAIGVIKTFRTVSADIDYHEHETKKQIVIKNIHCPISSTYRVIKYTRRGYWVNTPEILKLFSDWDLRDDDYRRQLFNFFDRLDEGNEPTEDEILHIERLLRID